MGGKHPGQLHEYSHSACGIVGSHHRLFAAGRVGVVVSPGAAIPVGEQKNAARAVGGKLGDDVAGRQPRAVEGSERGMLIDDICATSSHVGSEIVATAAVGIGAGHARTEVALRLHEAKCTVGTELNGYRGGSGVGGSFGSVCVGFSALSRRAAGYAQHSQYCSNKQGANILHFDDSS